MDKWKKTTIKANQAFEAENYQLALQLYHQACERAQKLLPHWLNKEEALVVLAVSYQNLADVYIRLKHPRNSFEAYQTLIQHLRKINPEDSEQASTVKHLASRIRTDILLAINTFDLVISEKVSLIEDIANLRTNSLEKIIEENCP